MSAAASVNGHGTARPRRTRSAIAIGVALLVAIGGVVVAATRASAPATIEEQVHQIGSQLQCVACLNISVADSPANAARAMRLEIERRLRGGQSAAQIKEFFVRKYGEGILLTPPARGFSGLVWVLPGIALLLGVVVFVVVVRRRVRRRGERAADDGADRLTPEDRARIVRELVAAEEPD